jgi:PhzF family phenazine biosynthesis protein
MQIPIYQVDAFSNHLFHGNPAAVCPLEKWLEEDQLQAIAAENNLSETAFFVGAGGEYDLRWFTPVTEVDLCGHATLATAFVIFHQIDPKLNRVSFSTQSGTLTVDLEGDLLSMDFPSRPPTPCPAPDDLIKGLKLRPGEVLASRDCMAVFDSEDVIQSLQPSMDHLSKLEYLGIIATAPGKTCDFVSRFFAPRAGVPEDPVTGSAHCTLVPYWSEKLGKSKLQARQISKRGGELFCEDLGRTVRIAGHATLYLEGTIRIE